MKRARRTNIAPVETHFTTIYTKWEMIGARKRVEFQLISIMIHSRLPNTTAPRIARRIENFAKYYGLSPQGQQWPPIVNLLHTIRIQCRGHVRLRDSLLNREVECASCALVALKAAGKRHRKIESTQKSQKLLLFVFSFFFFHWF